ncbi:MAG: hypothetical protein AB1758_28280 [Candidatus Eremiobacterota bacterium]
MAEDPRDKIEQIRARRGRDSYQSGGGLHPGAVSPFENRPQVGISQVGVDGIGMPQDSESFLGVDFKSPWLRDRVTLSLEGQIAMIEQRAAYRVSAVDLGYTNRITLMPLRPGIYIRCEPTGCYKLVYHNR